MPINFAEIRTVLGIGPQDPLNEDNLASVLRDGIVRGQTLKAKAEFALRDEHARVVKLEAKVLQLTAELSRRAGNVAQSPVAMSINRSKPVAAQNAQAMRLLVKGAGINPEE